jgi:predicted  nucleic acid-binding Zn-ribbon protein
MDWSLIGGIATIFFGAVAGTITLIGSRSDKTKSDRQLNTLQQSLDSLNSVNHDLDSMLQRANRQIDGQTSNINLLNKNLEPFIEMATRKYPDKDVQDALKSFKEDIEKFNKRVAEISIEVDQTKSK